MIKPGVPPDPIFADNSTETGRIPSVNFSKIVPLIEIASRGISPVTQQIDGVGPSLRQHGDLTDLAVESPRRASKRPFQGVDRLVDPEPEIQEMQPLAGRRGGLRAVPDLVLILPAHDPTRRSHPPKFVSDLPPVEFMSPKVSGIIPWRRSHRQGDRGRGQCPQPGQSVSAIQPVDVVAQAATAFRSSRSPRSRSTVSAISSSNSKQAESIPARSAAVRRDPTRPRYSAA